MPIDPNIPLQVKPFNIQLPVNQLAAVSEAMKIGEMNRGIDTQNKLRDLYSQGIDVGTPEGFKQVAAIDPATALKLRTDALKSRELEEGYLGQLAYLFLTLRTGCCNRKQVPNHRF